LSSKHRVEAVEPLLLCERSMTIEVALGRSLACCVHPSAAWRRLRPGGRVLLVGAYFGASYAGALIALLVL
jgi:hypothetical protein